MKRYLVAVIALAATVFVLASIHPYEWRPSALFHLDKTIADTHHLPLGTVILEVPAYDGAGYYQIARDIPSIFNPSAWPALRSVPPGAYAYQRFLLPLLAWNFGLGQEPLIPWAFLLINLTAIIGLAYFLQRQYPNRSYSIVALCLCPAAIVGLHFSLAEPLTLLLTTVFLVRFSKAEKIDIWNVALLCALVLTREVMVLFVGTLGLWLLYRQNWKSMVLLIIPVSTFVALHSFIYAITGDIPFLWSAAKNTLPFQAMLTLIGGGYGYNKYTATSIPLALGFVLPGLVWCLYLIWRKQLTFTVFGSLCFLGLMSLMPDHIWGSITSIGRVITPVYPLVWLMSCQKPGRPASLLLISMFAIGCIAAVGLISSIHPFHLA
jgi:hypothetical protein